MHSCSSVAAGTEGIGRRSLFRQIIFGMLLQSVAVSNPALVSVPAGRELLTMLEADEFGFVEYSEVIERLGHSEAVRQVEYLVATGQAKLVNPMIGPEWMFPDEQCAVISLPGQF